MAPFASADKRMRVLLENLTLRAADKAGLTLKNFGKQLYDRMIIFATTAKQKEHTKCCTRPGEMKIPSSWWPPCWLASSPWPLPELRKSPSPAASGSSLGSTTPCSTAP